MIRPSLPRLFEQAGLSADLAVRGMVLAHWQLKRGFDTSGNRVEIRRLQARMKLLARMQDRGMQSQEIETEAGAVEVKENADMARIQLIFPGKPDETTRRALKANGFRWSASQGAWQRHLNEAGRWAAQRVMKEISVGGPRERGPFPACWPEACHRLRHAVESRRQLHSVLIEEVPANTVKARVWYGRATAQGWEAKQDWGGSTFRTERAALSNERNMPLYR